LLGRNTATTKFVLWPVLDIAPERIDVLYKGATYRIPEYSISDFGNMCIAGSGGFISPIIKKI
jgi:hypothetical protein